MDPSMYLTTLEYILFLWLQIVSGMTLHSSTKQFYHHLVRDIKWSQSLWKVLHSYEYEYKTQLQKQENDKTYRYIKWTNTKNKKQKNLIRLPS